MDELLAKLITYAGDDYDCSQDEFLRTLIDDAIEEVRNEMYPRGLSSDAEINAANALALKRYPGVVRRIAEYHYDKRGVEGMVNYTESGWQTTYSDAGTPRSYLRQIIPVATIV